MRIVRIRNYIARDPVCQWAQRRFIQEDNKNSELRRQESQVGSHAACEIATAGGEFTPAVAAIFD
jgi:hypothetical protein